MPILPWLLSLSRCPTATTNRPNARTPNLCTRKKSRLFRMRLSLENVEGRTIGPSLFTELFLICNWCEYFSTFCSTSINNLAAILRCHPTQKSVHPKSLKITWLKSTFHTLFTPTELYRRLKSYIISVKRVKRAIRQRVVSVQRRTGSL